MVKRRRQHRVGVTAAMVMAAAAIGLSGCGGDSKSSGMDPIDWYRDLSGNSSNDTKDQAANSKNLAQGSKEPYPNLASVPKPPDNAITKADREKMAQSLVADRQNAQYTDEQLRAGQNLQAIAPPPQEPATPAPKLASAPAETPKVAAAPTPAPVAAPKVAAAPVAAVKQETLPEPTAKTTQTATPTPAPAPAPKVQQMAAVTPPAASPPEKRAAVTPAPEKKKKDQAKSKDDARKKQQAKRGSESPPDESTLRPPTIGGAMPEGEDAKTAPPQPPNTPNAPRQAAQREPSEEVAAASPSRSDVETPKGQRKNTEIKFTPGPYRARILPADHNRLVEVAKLAESHHARIRIVGYGGAPAEGDMAQREFQSFNAALDNAKAVGIELAKLGVPANRIDIETKANVNSADRAEVFVEY